MRKTSNLKKSKTFSIAAILLALLSSGVILGLSQAKSAYAQAGGPVILMGIDAEDCGPNGHGPITAWNTVVGNILSSVTNGGSGILVVGGEDVTQCIKPFFDAIASALGTTVTYGSTSASFAGFALVVVPSSENNTEGGLNATQSTELAARSSDFATHINNGGGVLGFQNCDLPSAYAYLTAGVGAVTCVSSGGDDITVTPEGAAVGLDNSTFDISLWHDDYLTFPDPPLKILANYTGSNRIAAIGGLQVVVPGLLLEPRTDTNPVGTTHTVTATVTTVVGGQTQPVPNAMVTIVVTGANTAGATCTTNAAGQCTFTYTGTNAGNDTISGSTTVGTTLLTDSVEKIWQTGPPVDQIVGGEIMPLDVSALFIAGATANVQLLAPILGGIASAAAVLVTVKKVMRSRRNKTGEEV